MNTDLNLGSNLDQEIVASLADLLSEAAQRHHSFEKVAPSHDWSDWYAAYVHARCSGISPDQSSAAAGRYLGQIRHSSRASEQRAGRTVNGRAGADPTASGAGDLRIELLERLGRL